MKEEFINGAKQSIGNYCKHVWYNGGLYLELCDLIERFILNGGDFNSPEWQCIDDKTNLEYILQIYKRKHY